jgi:DNA-binding MarR family transcriptional regulator
VANGETNGTVNGVNGVDAGGTTRLIDRLVEAAYVERQACPDDRRACYVGITPLGAEKFSEALSAHLDHLESHLAQRLNCDERRTLSTLLEKINDAF